MPMTFGTVQSGGSAGVGAGSIPFPDNIDETAPDYFYFGWEDNGGDWYVQRQDRNTGFTEVGTSVTYTTLAEAWPNRAALEY